MKPYGTEFWAHRTATAPPHIQARDRDLDTLDPETVKWVQDQIHPEDRVLEVGCGFGRWSELLNCSEYVGVDIVPARIEMARRRYPQREFVLVNDLEKGGGWATDYVADVVLFVTVLQHIPMEIALRVLMSAKAHLAEGGSIIMAEWLFYRGDNIYGERAPHMIPKDVDVMGDAIGMTFVGEQGKWTA